MWHNYGIIRIMPFIHKLPTIIMTIVNSMTGVFLIILGLLVKKYPALIAGYNTMSDKEKALTDIDGLSSMIRAGCIIMGIVLCISELLLQITELSGFSVGVMISILTLGAFCMAFLAQGYRKKPKK